MSKLSCLVDKWGRKEKGTQKNTKGDGSDKRINGMWTTSKAKDVTGNSKILTIRPIILTIRPIILTIRFKMLIFRPKIKTIRSKTLTIACCCCTDWLHHIGNHHRTMTASPKPNDTSFPLLDNTRRQGQELMVRSTGDVGVDHPGGDDHSRLSKHARGVCRHSRRRRSWWQEPRASIGDTTPTRKRVKSAMLSPRCISWFFESQSTQW